MGSVWGLCGCCLEELEELLEKENNAWVVLHEGTKRSVAWHTPCCPRHSSAYTFHLKCGPGVYGMCVGEEGAVVENTWAAQKLLPHWRAYVQPCTNGTCFSIHSDE